MKIRIKIKMKKILLSILLVCAVQNSFSNFFSNLFNIEEIKRNDRDSRAQRHIFKNLSEKQINLIKAAEKGNVDDVRKLLRDFDNINFKDAYGRTPLMAAVASGNTETVNLLIKSRADINAKDNYGCTVLMHATKVAIVKLLIASGADLHSTHDLFYYICDGRGMTQEKQKFFKATELMIAASCGCTNKVKILIFAGADINAKGADGKTALMFAAYGGHVDVVQALLDAGADINAKDNYGYTALMHAASFNRYRYTDEIVDLLIAAGADVNAKNNSGTTYLAVVAHTVERKMKD